MFISTLDLDGALWPGLLGLAETQADVYSWDGKDRQIPLCPSIFQAKRAGDTFNQAGRQAVKNDFLGAHCVPMLSHININRKCTKIQILAFQAHKIQVAGGGLVGKTNSRETVNIEWYEVLRINPTRG